jgi:hypothetical protein
MALIAICEALSEDACGGWFIDVSSETIRRNDKHERSTCEESQFTVAIGATDDITPKKGAMA